MRKFGVTAAHIALPKRVGRRLVGVAIALGIAITPGLARGQTPIPPVNNPPANNGPELEQLRSRQATQEQVDAAVERSLRPVLALLYAALGLLAVMPLVGWGLLGLARRAIVRQVAASVREDLLRTAQPAFSAELEAVRQASLKQFRQLQQDKLTELYGELETLERAISDQQARLAVREAADPELWFVRGNDASELGRDSEAVAAYEQALQVQPDFFAAWLNRGVALDRLGRYPEAIASFERALRLRPEVESLWYNRGTVLGKLGRHGEAVASFERAIRLKGNFAEAWSNRGTSLVKLGRYPEAIASFDRAVKLAPEFAGAWYGRSACYAVQNQAELAIEYLHEAVRLGGDRFRDLARQDPEFDSLRGRELFQWLLEGEA